MARLISNLSKRLFTGHDDDAKPNLTSAAAERMKWSPRLGATVPNFNCKTTHGEFTFHEFCKGDPEHPWTILFSHPKDFTPICTTELGCADKMNKEFRQLGIKCIGVSCDPVESHNEWIKDITAFNKIEGEGLYIPIIADTNQNIVKYLGMLDPNETAPEDTDAAKEVPLPARAVLVLDGNCAVRLSLLYPATTGRNFDELLRVVKSLKLAHNHGLSTPVNWKPGEKVVVPLDCSRADAQHKCKNVEEIAVPSGKLYLRFAEDPGLNEKSLIKTPEPNTGKMTPANWAIRLGAKVPNFLCETTQGDFTFHEFCRGDKFGTRFSPRVTKDDTWTLLLSHPADFTPVCTTELGAAHKMCKDFHKLGVKMIGLSCDDVDDHKTWEQDILAYHHIHDKTLNFPIIADKSREISIALGMLDPYTKDDHEGMPATARAVILIDENLEVRWSINYPASTGRNFNEILRSCQSLKLTASNGLGTPANWKPGDRVIVTPKVSTEDAKKDFKHFEQADLPSGKDYLRMVDDPKTYPSH